jgi:hypothetical protein
MSDPFTGKTRLVVCVTEVRGNNTYIARVAALVTDVTDTRRCVAGAPPTYVPMANALRVGDGSLRQAPSGRGPAGLAEGYLVLAPAGREGSTAGSMGRGAADNGLAMSSNDFRSASTPNHQAMIPPAVMITAPV